MTVSAAAAAQPPRLYEAIYILRPDVSREAAQKVSSRVQEVVQKGNGQLTLVEHWGRRLMAYDIEHNKRGVYVYVNYLGDGALVAELERNFRMLDEVMRFQTVKVAGDLDVAALKDQTATVDAYEPPTGDEEEELTLEQELGLVQGPRTLSARVMDDDDGMMDDDEDDE
jgi:small subunit ribosomal protein S6